MNPLADKLEDLRQQKAQVADKARAILDKPELTALEYLELLEEIQDYSARLTRRGEKWRIYEKRTRA